MRCLKPIKVGDSYFNCGQCINCRINHASQWKLRNLFELSQWKCASFVTLTFCDEWLYSEWKLGKRNVNSVYKRDLQTFFKRLRKDCGSSKPIKFFACGEYGERGSGKRPHYHAIIYGLDPWLDDDRKLIADNWLPRCASWHFDRSRGARSAIADVTAESIGYVAGYVQKKLTGKMAEKEYKERGVNPPFLLCSQGLGLDFATLNQERLMKAYTFMKGGQRIGIPKYLREKLGIEIKPSQTHEKCPNFDDLKRGYEKWLVKRFPRSSGRILRLESSFDIARYNRFFEYYLSNCEWSLAKQVEDDFIQRSKLRGSKI